MKIGNPLKMAVICFFAIPFIAVALAAFTILAGQSFANAFVVGVIGVVIIWHFAVKFMSGEDDMIWYEATGKMMPRQKLGLALLILGIPLFSVAVMFVARWKEIGEKL